MGKAVAVVSSNPTGGNLIFLFLKTPSANIVQKCQIDVENEKPEWATEMYSQIQRPKPLVNVS